MKNTSRNQKMQILRKQQLSGRECFANGQKRETMPKLCLHESNYEYSILNSRSRGFKGSRSVIKGKARLLCEKGIGKKTKKTDSLTRQEEDIPWECGQLGDKTRLKAREVSCKI